MKTTVTMQPITRKLNIYLADDDQADCLLFKEAIAELPVTVNLTTVYDGQQLIDLLTQEGNILPDALFLDLNMPRKNGFILRQRAGKKVFRNFITVNMWCHSNKGLVNLIVWAQRFPCVV